MIARLQVVTTISRMEMSHEVLVNGWWALVFSVVSVFLMYVFGKVSLLCRLYIFLLRWFDEGGIKTDKIHSTSK
ncbi:MAG: hypothetical protein JG782_808 [Anaerophaga sp.]|nr:hypothetical protein [Anaerophaga sp.]MDI3521097.1 hypothetical protein [Anaerophaga sp.]MDK2840940.1 hypothetical protein [Anaerophaga sp.]MDN5291213.1 hypothetical protein [Anaerophaga sp.]